MGNKQVKGKSRAPASDSRDAEATPEMMGTDKTLVDPEFHEKPSVAEVPHHLLATSESERTKEARLRLQRNRALLVENMRFKGTTFWDYLRQYGVVTRIQHEAKVSVPDYEAASWLLDHIEKRPASDLQCVLKALVNTGQGHLVDYFFEKDMDSKKEKGCVEQWQTEIARHYKRYHSRIPLCPFGPATRDVDLDSLYTSTTCVVRNKDGSQSPLENATFIFQNTGRPTMTLVQGAPGAGKSMLVNWCLSSWAEQILQRENQVSCQAGATSGAEHTKNIDFNYDMIVCIFLRYVKPAQSFAETFANQIWLQNPESATDIGDFIRDNPSKVLFLFDGLDEYNPETSREITSLLDGHLLPAVSKLVTTRHTQADSPSAKLVRFYDRQLELQGFDNQQVSDYIYKFLSTSKRHASKSEDERKELATSLYKRIESTTLSSFSKIPLHLSFLCQVAEASGDICQTKTQLFVQTLKYGLDVNLSKREPVKDLSLDNIAQYHDELVLLGTCAHALLGRKNSRFTFSKTSHLDGTSGHESALEMGIRLGLIIPVQPEHLGDTKLYTFIHLSVQEFLAAYVIVHVESERNSFISHICNIFRLHDFRNVIVFISGLSESCGNQILTHAVDMMQESTDEPSAHQCPYFNPFAWLTGEVSWKAEASPSFDISYFLAKCVSEYKDKQKCAIPLPHTLTIELSQTVTTSVLEMLAINITTSSVYTLGIKRGYLSNGVSDTILSALDLSLVFQLVLYMVKLQDSAALASSVKQMNELRHLTLQMDNLTETDSERLLSAIPRTLPLVRIWLSGFCISSCPDVFVSMITSMTRLVSLSIEDTDLSRVGCNVTSLAISKHLHQLRITDTNLTQEQIVTLFSALSSCCLQLVELCLSGNNISGIEHCVAADVSRLQRIIRLELRRCGIRSEGLLEFMSHLPPSLPQFDICDNPISNVSRLPENPIWFESLGFLWCQGTYIPDEDIKHLAFLSKQQDHGTKIVHDDQRYREAKPELDMMALQILKEIRKGYADMYV